MNLLTFDDFHDYQVRVIAKSIRLKHAALFLETGLGKTIVQLTIIDQLQKRGLIKSALVVAPKKVVFNTWRQECMLWDHTRRFKINIIHGDMGRGPAELVRYRQLLLPADIYLINYEGIPWLTKALQIKFPSLRLPFQLVAFDESTKMKKSTTQRFKAFRPFVPFFKYRYALTGTPMPNGLMDIFGQMYLVDQGASLGQYITSFRKRYFESYNVKGKFSIYTEKDNARVEVTNRIRSAVIHLKKTDYLKLPPFKHNTIYLDMSPKVRKLYESLEEEFFLDLGKAEIEAFSSSALSMKLRQFIQGNLYDAEGVVHNVHREKLDYLKDLSDGGKLEGFGNTIICYNFKFERDDLLSVFPKAPAIDSRTSERDAMNYIKQWNAGKHPVLLVNPASVAHGLNMQRGGNNILWYSLTWDYEHYSQMPDRLWRQGQPRPVFNHNLLFRDTVDEPMFASLSTKGSNQREVLSALREYNTKKTDTRVSQGAAYGS